MSILYIDVMRITSYNSIIKRNTAPHKEVTDNGGDAEEFKRMQQEYQKAFDRLKNVHKTQNGETYEKQTTETAAEFMDIIEKIIHFDGVKVEIIGSWIWLTGNTMAYKEEIKEAGFWWSKSKKSWYYNGETEKKHKIRGHYNMNQLREKWGSVEVEKEERQRITA